MPDMPMPYMNRQDPNFRTGEGAYQLVGGAWETGDLIFYGSALTVKMPKGQKDLSFRCKELQQVAFPQDTFVVVTDYFDPQTDQLTAPFFMYLEMRRAGYEVYKYSNTTKSSILLRRRYAEVEAVPRNKAKLQAFMLALVEDSPGITARVEQGEYKYADFPKLLRDYLATKPRQSATK